MISYTQMPPMDAAYDDSNIYSVEYNAKNLSNLSKDLNIQFYKSDVEHPMDNSLRMTSMMAGFTTTHFLTTEMKGLKLKNSFDINDAKVLVGLDGSERTWDGTYFKSDGGAFDNAKSIDNAVTRNKAIFATYEKSYGKYDVKAGARYDSTKISNDIATQQNNKYSGLNANIFTTYNIADNRKIFFGIGQAYRVPDARELYLVHLNHPTYTVIGTPDLEQTRNRQIDLGFEAQGDLIDFKVKTFYSDLENYIYYTKTMGDNRFANIDAKVYGLEIDSEFYASDDVTINANVSYKKGSRDKDANDNTDNLADITPLRATLGTTYEYAKDSTFSAELVMSDSWNDFDADNGEQKIGAWNVVNLKAKHAVDKQFDITLGVNNLFDKTYATTNTYNDITLVAAGGNKVLLNEPGRYLYTHLTYKF